MHFWRDDLWYKAHKPPSSAWLLAKNSLRGRGQVLSCQCLFDDSPRTKGKDGKFPAFFGCDGICFKSSGYLWRKREALRLWLEDCLTI